MNSLLIRGLRQRHVHGGRDWCELVTHAIQGKWPEPKASKRTQEVERELDIGGKPYFVPKQNQSTAQAVQDSITLEFTDG